MRIAFIILAFLFVACNKTEGQRMIGGVDKTPINFNVLIDRGTFAPSQSATARVNHYTGYSYGWLIGYTMSTYNGHWADQRGQVPPAPETFNPANVNVEAWVDSAEAHGADYLVLTVVTEYGFILYPSEVAYNMPQITVGATLSPYYPNYSIQAPYDTAIVSKFVAACVAKGIEPVFYFGYGGDMNLANTPGGQMWDAEVPAERKELFIQYKCKLAQEMARKFPRVKYYWADIATNNMPAGAMQRLYNAFKSINPDIVMIGNAVGESDFARFPYDIGSVEEYIAYNNPSYISQNTLSHGGTTYYIPREIVGTVYSDYSQWYYYDDLVPDQPVNNPFTGNPPYVKMQAVAPTTFQNLVNTARNANRPFLAAVFVDRNGNLVQETLNYLRQINFTAL